MPAPARASSGKAPRRTIGKVRIAGTFNATSRCPIARGIISASVGFWVAPIPHSRTAIDVSRRSTQIEAENAQHAVITSGPVQRR